MNKVFLSLIMACGVLSMNAKLSDQVDLQALQLDTVIVAMYDEAVVQGDVAQLDAAVVARYQDIQKGVYTCTRKQHIDLSFALELWLKSNNEGVFGKRS